MRNAADTPLHPILASAGVVCCVAAAVAAAMAREHMQLLGRICGPAAQPHCAWCFAALGLSLAGLGLLAASLLAPPAWSGRPTEPV